MPVRRATRLDRSRILKGGARGSAGLWADLRLGRLAPPVRQVRLVHIPAGQPGKLGQPVQQVLNRQHMACRLQAATERPIPRQTQVLQALQAP